MAPIQQANIVFSHLSLEDHLLVIYGTTYFQYGTCSYKLEVIFHRSLISKSEDSLQQPQLHFENLARVKRLMDTVKYTGPLGIGGDCTKVRQRLSYSNDFGSHVLGSTLPLDECVVNDAEDVDTVITRIKDKKAVASQVRAILVKVSMND